MSDSKLTGFNLPDHKFRQVELVHRFSENGPKRPTLLCKRCWDENTTQAFLSNTFEDMQLSPCDGRLDIPPLGNKALSVKALVIDGPGVVTGLEQFRALENLYIDSFPENGIDFKAFDKLQHISTDWDKRFIKDIFAYKNLQGLDVYEGFPDEDCLRYSVLPNLTYVGFTQGRIKSLNGLEACPNLESIGLAMSRNFSDLGDLTQFKNFHILTLISLPKLNWNVELTALKKLRTIHLQSLPTLEGVVGFTGLTSMEEISILECKRVIVDLSAIGQMPNLRKLHLNIPHVNLDLNALFSRKFIKIFQCKELGDLAESDVALIKRAEQHGRKITQISRPGPKKSRFVTVFFDHYEKRGFQ